VSESSGKKYVTEFIGTLVLVLMGCGSAVLAGRNFGNLAGIGAVGISFAFGLSVLVMVYAIGGISGCHITQLCPYLCWLRAN
jgi:aquaporin Z